MFRTLFVLFVLAICLAISANAEVVIKTKDGRTFKVAVDATEIASIEFSSSVSPVSEQPFAGRWTGTYHNSLGNSGASTLSLAVTGSGISGSLDGDPVQNGQWDGHTVSFTVYTANTKTNYRYQFQLSGEKKGKITYQATSPTRSYTGYADYVKQ